jgi:hypothetical protein
MAHTARAARLRREKGKATVRALHLSELESAGRARAGALAEAEKQLDRVARLLPDAVGGGLSLSEIAGRRSTSYGRVTRIRTAI